MKPASQIDAALERLGAERDAIVDKIATLVIEREALEHAIEVIGARPAEPETLREKRQSPGAVERAIRAALGEMGPGQNLQDLPGITGHKPASVAAALRRMVQTGAVDKVGELYRMHRAEQSEAAE